MRSDNYKELVSGVLQAGDLTGKETLEYKGRIYKRFMDGFYIDCSPAHLNEDQVFALCRARSDAPELVRNGPGNEFVKLVIETFVLSKTPLLSLELGAGTTPTFERNANGSEFIVSDADQFVVDQYLASGKYCIHFGKNCRLPFKNNFLDLVFAVFVFHFKIYECQIQEIARCLKRTGVVIANVYSIEESLREELLGKFRDCGLLYKRVEDTKKSCRDNEYWLLSFSEDSLTSDSNLLCSVLKGVELPSN